MYTLLSYALAFGQAIALYFIIMNVPVFIVAAIQAIVHKVPFTYHTRSAWMATVVSFIYLLFVGIPKFF